VVTQSGRASAAVFLQAVDQLGLAPRDVWHVGDSLTTDVAGAHAAGLHSVWLNRQAGPAPIDQPRPDIAPDIEIASLAELPALLQGTGTS